jgi:hypothetical protein
MELESGLTSNSVVPSGAMAMALLERFIDVDSSELVDVANRGKGKSASRMSKRAWRRIGLTPSIGRCPDIVAASSSLALFWTRNRRRAAIKSAQSEYLATVAAFPLMRKQRWIC